MSTVAPTRGERSRRLDRFVPDRRDHKAGRWYSRFVGLMKIVLPLLALMLIVLVAAWPKLQISTPPEEMDELRVNRGQMMEPRFAGTDRNGQAYNVIAYSAAQREDNPNLVDMTRPQAELMERRGAWLSLVADQGTYDQGTDAMHLQGSVNVFRDDGTEFVTEEAFVDLNAGRAWGDRSVRGHGPFGRLDAQGFRISQNGNVIVFTGESSLWLRQGGSDHLP